MGYMGKTGKTGIRVRVRHAEFQNGSKWAKVRTRNRNVTKNNTGAFAMKMEHGETRLGPGCGGIDWSSGTRLQ